MMFVQKIPEILAAIKEMELSEIGTIIVIALLVLLAMVVIVHKKKRGSPPKAKTGGSEDKSNIFTRITIEFKRETNNNS